MKPDLSRRDFLKTSSLVAGAAALGFPAVLRADGTPLPIKVGVIGCGGRGAGAALNALESAPGVTIVALGDLFADRVANSRKKLADKGVTVADENCFIGWDAYQKVLAIPEINYVILTTPPHFRPAHFAAAITAGKHVFMEKSVAVDAPGVRSVLATGELARLKGLSVVAGTQRRHSLDYRETIKRLQDGAIGDIVAARCYWNQGGLWKKDRQPEWSDMEWQIRNWLYFTWLSGDHIVEQHVHNIDVINWVKGTHPIKASGMGGRQSRTSPEYGHIYDHFAIEFQYADGTRLNSQCRQMDGCAGNVSEAVVGTKGTSDCAKKITFNSGEFWRYEKTAPNPYVQEHTHLVESIRADKPLSDTRAIAESTLTAVMGRMAAYSGQVVDWDTALNSKEDLTPAKYELGPLAVAPVAMPGKYKVV